MCGCALRSLGTPCVAQRVCAMPSGPVRRVGVERVLQLRTLPTVRRRLIVPVPLSTATPAES